jgi:tetratricopeptide (TPR) repeat protein
MRMAARAASPRNRESFAWAFAKLAQYELQAGARDRARTALAQALEVFPESAPALKAQAQLALAEGAPERALAPLRKAISLAPHPELHWMLIESLTALGRSAEAEQARSALLAAGRSEDPRSFALYLATRHEQLELAQTLVSEELAQRSDVYTYEALGWVQSARGEQARALESARRSLAAGTQDARLYYHAGVIAERAGDLGAARDWLARAEALAPLLLPSQRAELRAMSAALWRAKASGGQRAAVPVLTVTTKGTPCTIEDCSHASARPRRPPRSSRPHRSLWPRATWTRR